jgi:hypothetical protein
MIVARGLTALVLAVLLSCTWTASVRAQGEFTPYVHYQCDTARDRVVLKYGRMRGEELYKARDPGTFNPGKFITYDQKTESVSLNPPMRKECRLSDGIYSVELSARPDNLRPERTCGA